MTALIVVANVLGWPVIHLAFSWVFLCCPDVYFAEDFWLTRERRFEKHGRFYRRALGAHRWKGFLPDGAPWLGGRSKVQIRGRHSTELKMYLIEARRAEAAHWCMLICTPVFYLWNPAWARVVMTVYGLTANLPCIIAQRANRAKIASILHHSERERILL